VFATLPGKALRALEPVAKEMEEEDDALLNLVRASRHHHHRGTA
jgi:hypothetical protein